MKKLCISLLLVSLLLCACAPAPNHPIAETSVPTASHAETTSPTEVPVVTEAVWSGYSGTSKGYIYLHSEQRDHNWEEDILYFADSYLDDYAKLTHYPFRIEYVDDVEYEDFHYDPDFRNAFIEQINTLIPQIPTLTDTELLYQLQRIISLLRDAHASIIIDSSKYFPIGFEPFYEDDMWIYRVSCVPSQYEHTMMAKLVGINDTPVTQIIEKLKPYISYENENWLSHCVSGGGYPGSVSELSLLRACDILDKTEITATYNLITVEGESLDITLTAQTIDQFLSQDLTGMTHNLVYPSIYSDSDTFYFHRMYPEHSMMYVRIKQFETMPEYTFLEFGNQIIREVREVGGLKKIVIDLRRNPGGSQFLGYVEFINALKRMDIDDIYVLVDQGTFSCAILMASTIKYTFPDSVLVGTPAGQPPNFFAGMWDGDYMMPNCEVVFRMPTAYYCILQDYTYDALMPDLIVYPTLEDYVMGIDTIFEAVKAR